jgi:NAD(P)H-hydrate repair Nnr-like enzyme with NAD(P)H-hydrate dehydratase domain
MDLSGSGRSTGEQRREARSGRDEGDARQLCAANEALASDLPVVLDAGGLDLLDGPRPAPTLLTPHAGEAARLLTRLLRSVDEAGGEVTRAAVEADPVGAARRIAELTGATVLLKGSTTLVLGSSGPVRSQSEAPPWLATAGTGDVLAGLLGILLAAGLSPLDAGSLGALVHGLAADRASAGGPLRALKVAHAIPEAVREVLTRWS